MQFGNSHFGKLLLNFIMGAQKILCLKTCGIVIVAVKALCLKYDVCFISSTYKGIIEDIR